MLARSLAATACWLLQQLKVDECQFLISALKHAVCTLLEYIMCTTNHNVKHSCKYLKCISSSKETVNGKFTFTVDSMLRLLHTVLYRAYIQPEISLKPHTKSG